MTQNILNPEIASTTPSGLISAPFSIEQVQSLNEWQTHTGEGFPAHPFTCANRSEHGHGQAGGETGLLIATESGWVCPDCDYTQNWAHAMMTRKSSSLIAVMGPSGRMLVSFAKKHLEQYLPEYQKMADEGKTGASVMVECLLRRRAEMESTKSKGDPLVSWTIYDHPQDFPDVFVARKWLVLAGIPEPQPTNDVLTDADLDTLRSRLPPGLTKLLRLPGDDLGILEVWM